MPQVKVTSFEVRPSTDVDFFDSTFTEEINTYIEETYKDTGKLVSQQLSYSEDRLTRTGVRIFDSQESRDQLVSDPIFRNNNLERTLYNKQNGITITVIAELLS